jgi:hypothetical protein
MANLSFHHLQNTHEIGRVYSLSVFIVHYFLNRLHHLRHSFKLFAEYYLKLSYVQDRLLFQDNECKCIICRFPDMKIDKLDETLEQYFNSLNKQTPETSNFMLAVLEKCFDIQCLHTMIIQQQYPHLDKETINHFVTAYDQPKE